ncbi:MAG: hypothetical protein KY464_04480 [Gemmatimonadetes bacterium]|nr:hypothetical protein [Gemmatimonadota bacterium]
MPLFAIVWAGFVSVILAAAVFWAFRALRLTEFSPSIHLGCLFLRNPGHPATETTGFLLLVVLGSSIIPIVYERIFGLLGGPSWAVGLGLGAIHGLVASALLPAFGTISACIRAGAIPAPGAMGTKWGWLTPFAMVVGHGLYGAVCGAILDNL